MNPLFQHQLLQTRRHFFGNLGLRFGGLAMAMMAGNPVRPAFAAPGNIAPAFPPIEGLPHFPPIAKSVIYLHMNGGPTQMDLWDHKPQLQEYFDKDLPESVRKGQRITTMTSGQTRLPVAPSK